MAVSMEVTVAWGVLCLNHDPSSELRRRRSSWLYVGDDGLGLGQASNGVSEACLGQHDLVIHCKCIYNF